MTDDRMNALADDVAYIRTRVDTLGGEVGDLRVSVENRVSKLEVKAGIFGLLGGLLAGFARFKVGE